MHCVCVCEGQPAERVRGMLIARGQCGQQWPGQGPQQWVPHADLFVCFVRSGRSMPLVHFLLIRNVQTREMLLARIQRHSQAAPCLGSWKDARHSPFRQLRGCVFRAQADPPRGWRPGPAPSFFTAHFAPRCHTQHSCGLQGGRGPASLQLPCKCRSPCANGTCHWQRIGELGGAPGGRAQDRPSRPPRVTAACLCRISDSPALPHTLAVPGTGSAHAALVPASMRASPPLKTARLALPEEIGFQQFAGFLS